MRRISTSWSGTILALSMAIGELLHDGRTTDRGAAIQAHSGQAAASATAYNALTTAQKSDLLSFLGVL